MFAAMELVYLYHSGFALLGEGFTIVFDFFEDSLSENEGVLHEELLERPGRFYVLASHFHADHFNRQVLGWKRIRPDIICLFSKDILRRRRAQKEDAVWLRRGDTYSDGTVSVKAFGSTDVGVSFLVEAGGKKIFHAGDLNNWHWMDECEEAEWKGYEKNYLHELERIAVCTEEVDVVLFPVDPRLGKEYMRGPHQFVERIKTAIFVPMHFDEAYAQAAAFAPVVEANGGRMIVLSRRGQRESID